MRCDACSQPVLVQDELVCNQCYSRYHYICAGYEKSSFKRMTYSIKVNWRCGICHLEPVGSKSPCATPPVRCVSTSPCRRSQTPPRCPPRPCPTPRACSSGPQQQQQGGGGNFAAMFELQEDQSYKLELLLREIDKARTETESSLERLQGLEGMKEAVDFAIQRVEEYEEKLTNLSTSMKEKNDNKDLGKSKKKEEGEEDA